MSTANPSQAEICECILENQSAATLLFDQDLHLIHINLAGTILFGLGSRQLLGVRAGVFLRCPGPSVEHSLRRALDTAQAFTERELLMPIGNGHIVTVDCTATPLLESNRLGAILVELRQVDRQMRMSREESLLAQNSATRSLLRGLAHEIKNPLGGVRGAAQLLQRQLDSESLREYTQIIIDEADRLKNLVDRMLGSVRPVHKSEVNIHQVLERVRGLVEAEAPSLVRICHDYDPSLPTLQGDLDQLIQAILNIVLNAAQALGESGEILLRTRIARQMIIGHHNYPLLIRVEVIDNGPGIPPELLPQIFLPMVTGRVEGSGLGLPLAQSIINRHEGLVECTSTPGETIFTILLPLEGRNA